MTKICLHVPRKGDPPGELRRLLFAAGADIHIFPESFLRTDTLDECLRLIRESGAFVIAGYRDTSGDSPQEKALVIDRGAIIGESVKCVLTRGEKRKGMSPGSCIRCVPTRFGRIGIPICYEIHFPEVSRILALESPVLLVNIVGTGMYHEMQFSQWTALARARAIENEVHVVGCCHHTEGIPLAFAYRSSGEILLEAHGAQDSYCVELDLSESLRRPIGYFGNRKPALFSGLTQPVKPKVAFICVHNSCRSQIAEALCRHLAGDVLDAYSAGTETKPRINPDAVRLMKELYGIDMEQSQYSKTIADIPAPDIAISMGCGVRCPFIGRAFDADWGLPDPTGCSDEVFRDVIRSIENAVLALAGSVRNIPY